MKKERFAGKDECAQLWKKEKETGQLFFQANYNNELTHTVM